MAKLTQAAMRSELSRRMSGMITENTTLDAALDRAVRFIDSLASYTFLQKYASAALTAASEFNTPTDINLQKEIKLYINGIRLNYVPYSELKAYTSILTITPTAFAYVQGTTDKFYLNAAVTATYYLYYTRIMTVIGSSTYPEIPEQWYDIILDVAEMQQKDLYRVVLAEQAAQKCVERLKMFMREFNATQEANININDEMIRKGA